MSTVSALPVKRSAVLALALCGFAACRLPAPKAGDDPSVGHTRTEDQIFDANREAPVDLLAKLYEEKKVLILASPTHRHETYYHVLSALLDKVGRDPRLKYIVHENFIESAPVLEDLSVNHVAEADLRKQFASDSIGIQAVCMTGEVAYAWAKLLPEIRAINTRRPAGRKLRVTTVDGVFLSSASIPDSMRRKPPGVPGWDREWRTTVNFQKMWKDLAPSEKIIVLYNNAHVVKSLPVRPGGGGAMSGGPNWLSKFLSEHPAAEAQVAVVVLDYKASDIHTRGVFKLTQRQAARYPGQAFGIRLAPFRSVARERGDGIFASGSGRIDNYQPVDSTAGVADIADAVVWWPAGERERHKESTFYLPVACRGTYQAYLHEVMEASERDRLFEGLRSTEAQAASFEQMAYHAERSTRLSALSPGLRTKADSQRALQFVADKLGELRAKLPPEQQAIFDPRARAWIKRREQLDGYRVNIRGLAP